MNAALAFGDRDALDTVDAALEFKLAVGIIAANLENYFFHAASFVLVLGDKLWFQIMGFGVFNIHTIELTGKEGSFVATGASADFKNSRLIIFWIARDEELF